MEERDGVGHQPRRHSSRLSQREPGALRADRGDRGARKDSARGIGGPAKKIAAEREAKLAKKREAEEREAKERKEKEEREAREKKRALIEEAQAEARRAADDAAAHVRQLEESE